MRFDARVPCRWISVRNTEPLQQHVHNNTARHRRAHIAQQTLRSVSPRRRPVPVRCAASTVPAGFAFAQPLAVDNLMCMGQRTTAVFQVLTDQRVACFGIAAYCGRCDACLCCPRAYVGSTPHSTVCLRSVQVQCPDGVGLQDSFWGCNASGYLSVMISRTDPAGQVQVMLIHVCSMGAILTQWLAVPHACRLSYRAR